MSIVIRRLIGAIIVALALAGCDDAADRPSTSSTSETTRETPARAADPVAGEARAAVPAAKTPSAKTKMAPTPAIVRRDTELKATPSLDAATIKRLARGSKLVIADREGGWLNVVSGQQSGWVRLLHVDSQPPGSAGISRRELETAAKIATGRAGGGNVVATTGIRGLSEEELRTAEPNPEELKKLESYGISGEQAAEYARTHDLARRDVPNLPAPPS